MKRLFLSIALVAGVVSISSAIGLLLNSLILFYIRYWIPISIRANTDGAVTYYAYHWLASLIPFLITGILALLVLFIGYGISLPSRDQPGNKVAGRFIMAAVPLVIAITFPPITQVVVSDDGFEISGWLWLQPHKHFRYADLKEVRLDREIRVGRRGFRHEDWYFSYQLKDGRGERKLADYFLLNAGRDIIKRARAKGVQTSL